MAGDKEKSNLDNITAYSSSNDNVNIVRPSNPRSEWSKSLRMLEVEKAIDGSSAAVANADLLPVPPHGRTWGKVTYALYWFGESASVTSWTVAATGVKGGLSWWKSWLCVIFGHMFVCIPLVMTGRPGASYKIPFPIIARASFGIWGAIGPCLTATS
ncbi:hypothetical protein P154DRAFT_524295 [Amniculicola lignicola CBS 123094]|uniref:Uncharacterized protein n=1 Tax=Amniculicola lignicola CBS 123094 TaxID=1392246 RepID=A0A6A5WCV3_9PLEO|nr:hypothetical protein P154DRAFT_524295 [Amniculicola lignicola CBS 123094]